MKLKDWFRARKEKREAKRLQKLAAQTVPEPIPEPEPIPAPIPEPAPAPEAETVTTARPATGGEVRPELDRELHEVPLVKPLGVDTSEIVPPDTRFTEEYQEFLKKHENVDPITGNRREEK